MFVDIESSKSALAVENILMPYKKGRLSDDKKTRLPKEPITPEVCMEILKSTNYARNIKDMLLCIAELPQEEQAQFKEVVLACFDKREQPNDVLVLGKKLAVAHGFEGALGEVVLQDDDEEFLASLPFRAWTYRTEDADLRGAFSLGDYDRLLCLSDETILLGMDPQDSQASQYSEVPKMPAIIEAPNSWVVILDDCNSAKLRKISLKEGGELYLRHLEPWPQELDVLQCEQVHLDMGDFPTADWKYKPDALCLQTIGQFYANRGKEGASFDGVVDFSAYGSVVLAHGNYSADTKLVFREGASVKLYDFVHEEGEQVQDLRMLPDGLDVSNCSKVEIEYDDISNLKNLRFRDGAKVSLTKVHKLPENLDFSQCDEVNLSGCDLANQPNLRFKKGAKVCLANVKNLPTDIDLSECDEVDLSGCDLSKLSQVRFKKGAKICLKKCKNLPNDFDFSEFPEVDLSGCDLANQPNLRFQKGAKVCLNYVAHFPHHLDFSECSEVQLQYCDLADLARLNFADGAKAILSGAKNFPKETDVSLCSSVALNDCDLANLSKLSFGNEAKVILSDAKNLPKDIDFSNCVYVEARRCDMSNQCKMSFAKGAKVDLRDMKNLTGCLDFSSAAEVRLEDSNLEKVTWMGFGEKAKVKLRYLQNLPPHIDFSPCSKLLLDGLNLQKQDALCFRNKSSVYLYDLQNLPKFMDVSLCKEVDIPNVSLKDVKEFVARDYQQIKKCQIIWEKDWKNKTVFTADMSEEQRKIWDLKRQKKLQLIRQNSEEQKLIEPKIVRTDSENDNVFAKLWGKMKGKGRP